MTLLLGAFIAIVLRQIFLYSRDIFTAGVQFELLRRVRNLGFDRYIHANLGYHDRVRAGDFVNELTTELHYAAASSLTAAANFFGYVLLAVVYLTLAALLSGYLTLIAFGSFSRGGISGTCDDVPHA